MHASEQNLRCFVPSAFPHSVHVFGEGGCIPCHARLEAGSSGRGCEAGASRQTFSESPRRFGLAGRLDAQRNIPRNCPGARALTSNVVCFAFVNAPRLIDPRQCARAALCYAGNISAAQCLPTLQCCDVRRQSGPRPKAFGRKAAAITL